VDVRGVLQIGQKGGDGDFVGWYPQVRSDGGQGRQVEATIPQTRVRNGDLGSKEAAASVEQEVDVQRPRTMACGALASGRSLESLQYGEKIFGLEVDMPDNGGVQEIGLGNRRYGSRTVERSDLEV
jgi:hypothetical protein